MCVTFGVMIHQGASKLLFLIGILTMSYGCQRDDCEGSLPTIEFKAVSPISDQDAILQLTFNDCDGDIGLDPEDTTGIFALGSRYYYNLYVDYYELEDGEWVDYTGFTQYRIPRLESDGASDRVEGEIQVTIKPYYFSGTANDTFRYEIILIDRSRNETAPLVSPSFVKP